MPHSPGHSAAGPGADPHQHDGDDVPSVELAERLGVVRHMTETYTVGGFRYTSLTDAIAQARRLGKLERELI